MLVILRTGPVFLASTLLAGFAVASAGGQGGGGEEDRVRFARDVRPLLAERCFVCHGPDEEQRAAELRLDTREGLQSVVDVDHPGGLLLERVGATDLAQRMPPPDAGEALEPHEQETLRRWIEEGAEWTQHWSFVAPVRPVMPEVRTRDWVQDDLDRFVLARLEQEGLSPSAEADRATLLRRLSFDLTGLPPSLEELDAFTSDQEPGALERVVERLLDSPHYGERLATPWLDRARYADTNGYSIDGGRHMWAWRDWVVQAFNDNLPFDRFVVEQLAGDLLPDPGQKQLIASGFNRNHMVTHEGGTIPEEYRVAYVVDRVKTTSQALMGLTLGCAQCHDHKYDPISQEEYYGFFAYFNTITDKGLDGNSGINPRPSLPVLSDGQWAELTATEARMQQVQAELNLAAEHDPGRHGWERDLVARLAAEPPPVLGEWSLTAPFRAANGDEAFDKDFGPESAGAEGLAASEGPEEIQWHSGSGFPDGVAHQLNTPNAATYLKRRIRARSQGTMRVSFGSDDALKVWLNGKLVLENRVQRGVAADQELLELDLDEGENQLLLKIVNYGGPGGFYFRRLSDAPPAEVLEALETPPEQRERDQRKVALGYFQDEAPQFQGLRDLLEELEERNLALRENALTTVMVMEEMAMPRETFVLERGQYNQPGARVEPAVPSCLPGLPPGAPANRLGLAQWLTDPDHPLTARVAVNGYWQMLFGVGLVETSEDFGTQGAWPSHPGLLDYLAREFVDSGWDVRALLKRIVLSATYRQSSGVSPDLLARDPGNRLLARGPRFRLSAEFIRDNALAVSGLLVREVGGPGVKPYQPPGLWREMSHFGSTPATEQVYEQGTGADLYRRSLYTVHKRTVPPPSMEAFDVPSRELCVSRRSRTNTPLQALVLLNDPTFVEAARVLAQRILREGGADTDQRLRFAFRAVTGQAPTQAEYDILSGTLQREHERFLSDPEAAGALLDVGASARDSELPRALHAAWTVVASTLLNLNRTITRG